MVKYEPRCNLIRVAEAFDQHLCKNHHLTRETPVEYMAVSGISRPEKTLVPSRAGAALQRCWQKRSEACVGPGVSHPNVNITRRHCVSWRCGIADAFDEYIKCHAIDASVIRDFVISRDRQNAKMCDVLPSLLSLLGSAMKDTIYAIGDVHGRSDLLANLISFVETHSRLSGHEPRVFFLGDIVDRGPDSRGAMEIVVQTIARWPRSRLILGNHEEMFLNVLKDTTNENSSSKWLWNYGMFTQYSYTGLCTEYWPEFVAEIPTRFPSHYDLMCSASSIELVGRYAFVHAGVDPRVPLSEQDPKKSRWIGREFLDHVGPLSHVIVHGHTVLDQTRPVVTENRISLDTGAYHSGVLSLAIIDPESDHVEFYSTSPDGEVRAVEPILEDRGYGSAYAPIFRQFDRRVGTIAISHPGIGNEHDQDRHRRDSFHFRTILQPGFLDESCTDWPPTTGGHHHGQRRPRAWPWPYAQRWTWSSLRMVSRPWTSSWPLSIKIA